MSRLTAKRPGFAGRLGPLAVSVLLLLSGIPVGSVAGAEPLSPLPRAGQVRLASGALREAVARLQQGRAAGPGVQMRGGMIRVEVLHHLTTPAVERLIANLGGTVEGDVPGELVQALVPFDRLVDLEADPGVDFVRPPLVANEPAGEQSAARPAADKSLAPASLIVGSEVTKTNATAWHAAGYTGSGVKIGIIDYFGTTYWNAAVAAGELPTPAGTFCIEDGSSCDIWAFEGEHGEGVAEIIHEMAPGAQLYLASAYTAADLQAAVTYFASQGVKVISRSLTAEYDGPGDGTGPIATVINNSVAAGMAWFNSAGNNAGSGTEVGSYWRGSWVDADADGWLDFAPGVETLVMGCWFVNGLRWSDWGANRTDYDLGVWDDAALTTLKATGVDDQVAGAPPLEHVSLNCGTNDLDYVRVQLYAAGGGTAGDTLEFMVNGSGLSRWQNPYSATGPATDTASAGAVAVGAIDPAAGITIAPYSSQGPTNDGRTKPDLSAASCVASFTYSPGCFAGTSAATPVVAGAAALVLQAGLANTPAQLKTYLLTKATVDRGAAGTDNVYGAGELVLPNPAATNDFSIGASPASRSVVRGASTMYTVTTAVTSGSAETVALSITSGLPANTTASFSPASVTAGASSTLTISTTASTPIGGPAILTITGVAPSATHATTVSLTVTASGLGYLRVTTSPALPAQISLNGVIADSWGLNWLELPPGDYTVGFSHVEGYSEPADQVVTVTVGATTTVAGTFTARGSLRVTTSPAVAGQISVDGIPRNNWGMWTDLPTGAHQVCFGPLAGYTPPTCQSITVNAGALTNVTGTYTVSP